MKYLIVFAIVFVVAWRWRTDRQQDKHMAQRKKPAAAVALNMVACTECGLHVPISESVQGKKGHYCSKAHLLHSEQ